MEVMLSVSICPLRPSDAAAGCIADDVLTVAIILCRRRRCPDQTLLLVALSQTCAAGGSRMSWTRRSATA